MVKLCAFFLSAFMLLASVAGAAPRKKVRATKGPAQKRARIADSQAKLTPELVNAYEWTSATPAAILRAQILLGRAHFSVGEMDGRAGENFTRALRGFQESRQLPVTGELDPATWHALNVDTAPAVTTYSITDADVAGPFVEVPQDMLEQAKLQSLAYSTIQELLGEKFHVSPGLLQRLNVGKKLTSGESIVVPDNGAGVQGTKAARIVVTKAGVLTAFDGADKIIAQYPCSSGSEHDPLPIGTWKVTGIAKNPPFFYNPALFWDASPGHTKAKIAPGPNNPVGVVWIDLSKEHYGIHGTPLPGNVGHTESHGCIRLTNWDAQELAGIVSRGTPVVCQE